MQVQSPVAKMLIVFASLIIIMAGIKAATTIVVPFFLSIFIAIACGPIIKWSSTKGVPRWASIVLVILLILIVGFMIAGLVAQSMAEFRENLPNYKEQMSVQFDWIVNQLARFNIELNRELVQSHLDPGLAMSIATNFLSGMGGVLSNLILILLTVVFMLFEAESLPRRIHIAMSDPEMEYQHVDRFIQSVNSYLAIKTVISLFTGLIIGIYLSILGVDHFLLWAVLAFLLNYIPNIGSIVAAVPAVMMAFIEQGWGVAGLTALGFVVVNMVMGNVVEPRFMGKGLGLSTLVVFLSLIFWGWLLGSVGMLLSVPLTMVVKIALESRPESQWLAILLSSDGNVQDN